MGWGGLVGICRDGGGDVMFCCSLIEREYEFVIRFVFFLFHRFPSSMKLFPETLSWLLPPPPPPLLHPPSKSPYLPTCLPTYPFPNCTQKHQPIFFLLHPIQERGNFVSRGLAFFVDFFGQLTAVHMLRDV